MIAIAVLFLRRQNRKFKIVIMFYYPLPEEKKVIGKLNASL